MSHKGLALWITMNEGDFGNPFLEIIGFSLLDAMLTLEPIDLQARMLGTSSILPPPGL